YVTHCYFIFYLTCTLLFIYFFFSFILFFILLFLFFFLFFFLMIRRPPRSTLFPTRRSSDLSTGKPARVDERGRESINFLTEKLIDRKSTRLNSSHVSISYAVFCLKKKKKKKNNISTHKQKYLPIKTDH